MATIDTLKLARELRDRGGFTQEAAEATAEALNNALGENALGEQIATKRDIAQLGSVLRSEMVQLGSELRGEMVRLHNEILKWMFGQAFVILAAVAALHFVK